MPASHAADMTPEEALIAKDERRLKRAARRAKQRLANVTRAEKMHALRLRFEADHGAPSTPAALQADSKAELQADPKADSPAAPSADQTDAFTVHVGCSGWFYWRWRGDFYPQEMPTSDWFAHYTTRFRTVEINASFYSWPTEATVKTWLQQAGRKRFVYTVKVCELITHVKRFEETETLIKDFGFIARMLGPRMGCFLFQLPPSVHYSEAMLQLILSQLDHTQRNVVEFRHASWWTEEVYAAFRKTGTIFCSCSGPRLPDELVRTADDIYLRFHGVTQWYRHDYSKDELHVWAERIRQSGAKQVWAYFNNDYGGFAPKNARTFASMLRG